MISPDSPFSRGADACTEHGFAQLFARHRPMVAAVCRRVLSRPEDAEDACQAVFLVLARSGGAVRDPRRLAAWLHRVATRCAWRLHHQISARARREAPLHLVREPAAAATVDEDAWEAALDCELDRLPERYRLPLALCYLEGRRHDAVAGELGLTRAGLKTRLERGRAMLRERLLRRGLKVGAAAAALEALRGGAASAQLAFAIAPSAQAMALSQAVRWQLTVLPFAAKALPLAAAVAVAIAFLVPPPTAAEAAKAGTNSSRSAPAAGPAVSATRIASQEAAHDYPRVIPWKPGTADLPPGAAIQITEVRGTKDHFERGGRYFVRGTYRLAAPARGRLYFGLSGRGADGYTSGEEPEQSRAIAAGEGEFTLSRYFQSDGEPHITLYDETGRYLGSLYLSDGQPGAAQSAPGEDQVRTLLIQPDGSVDAEATRRADAGLDQELMLLKTRADEGDLTAAGVLAQRALAQNPPNFIQAYRWFYVAGDLAKAGEIQGALTPEDRLEADRVTAAYIQRPTAPKGPVR